MLFQEQAPCEFLFDLGLFVSLPCGVKGDLCTQSGAFLKQAILVDARITRSEEGSNQQESRPKKQCLLGVFCQENEQRDDKCWGQDILKSAPCGS